MEIPTRFDGTVCGLSCPLMELKRVVPNDAVSPFRRWMQVAPLSPLAIGLIAGLAIAQIEWVGQCTGLFIIGLALLAAIRRGLRRRFAPLIVMMLSVGAGVVLFHSASAATDGLLRRSAAAEGPIVRLRGVISTAPMQKFEPNNPFAKWIHTGASTSFVLDVEAIKGEQGWTPAPGRVRVTVASVILDASVRDRVEVFGRLLPLSGPANPGATDWRGYFLRQGIVARMFCDSRRNVQRIESQKVGVSDAVNWLRRRAVALLVDEVSASADEETTLLEAMVLGHRSRFDRRLDEIFTRAGVIHFIAVSGTNVVVLMGFVWLVGRLFHRTKRQCTAAMVAAILLYVCVAEPRPPILRAAVMGLLFCTALWTGRARAHLNWLSAAAIILIGIDPLTVFDVGFQLSFAAVLGVAYLGPALLVALREAAEAIRVHVLRDPYARLDAQLARRAAQGRTDWAYSAGHALRGALRVVIVTLAVSVAAWLVTLPIIMLHFHAAQPWAPISSALVFPLMSLVMVLGLAKVLVGGFSTLLDASLGAVLGGLDRWLIAIVERLAALPGAGLTVPTPPWWVVTAFYALLVAVVIAFRDRSGADFKKSSRTAAMVLCVIVFAATSSVWWTSRMQRDALVVTVLSVGRGSAMVVELPHGTAMMFDAGSSFASDPAPAAIVPFLCHQGITRLDRLYISHPNLDHFSGVPTLLERIPTGPVVLNACFDDKSEPRSASRHLLNLLRKRNHPTRIIGTDHRQWKEGDVTMEMLWPDPACDASLSANDASTVLRISYAGRSILFTGDIERQAQAALLQRGNLQADVLVLPHHGSVEPTTKAFVDAVSPSIVIRSTHERSADTVSGLQARLGDAALYNTADIGAIQVSLSSRGVEIATPSAAAYSSPR